MADKFMQLLNDLKKVIMARNAEDGPTAEYVMLHIIDKFGSKSVSTAIISERLNISKPAVSQMMKILEDKKYIKREINNNDRRLINVSLTKMGSKILEEKKCKMSDKFSAVLDRMGKEDSEELIRLMEKYITIMKGEQF